MLGRWGIVSNTYFADKNSQSGNMNFSTSGRTRVHLSLGVNATLPVSTDEESVIGVKPGSLSPSLVGTGTYEDIAEVGVSSPSSSTLLVVKEAKARVEGSRNVYVTGIRRGKT
jgi:hypothetical protein